MCHRFQKSPLVGLEGGLPADKLKKSDLEMVVSCPISVPGSLLTSKVASARSILHSPELGVPHEDVTRNIIWSLDGDTASTVLM